MIWDGPSTVQHTTYTYCMCFFQSWQKNQIVHQVLPPLLISSLGIKSCKLQQSQQTAAIPSYRTHQWIVCSWIFSLTLYWFHLMGNLTPSWVSFHFCIHHDKLIVASISIKVRVSSVKKLHQHTRDCY